MNVVKISDIAYNEFKEVLDQNKLDNYMIRINLAGMGWGGPVFNIVQDEQKENDTIEKVKDVTFIVDKSLINDFESFEITCEAENGRGLMLEATSKPGGGGHSTCTSCGH